MRNIGELGKGERGEVGRGKGDMGEQIVEKGKKGARVQWWTGRTYKGEEGFGAWRDLEGFGDLEGLGETWGQ